MDYDLMVIGDSREGMELAISVASKGRRVAVIGAYDPEPSLDVMRLAMTMIIEQQTVTMAAWRAAVARLARCRMLVDDCELEIVGAEWIDGSVRFVSPTSVEVSNGTSKRILSGREIVVACGTRSRCPVPLCDDERFILRVESLLNLPEIPRSMIVVGAGETGISAAIMLATLGIEVIVVDGHVSSPELNAMIEALFHAAQSLKIAIRLGDEAIGTELRPDLQAAVRLASGKHLVADAVLICVGREGRTNGLNLEAVGVGIDERGRLWCDNDGKTWVSSISAAGDVVGFPRMGDQSTDATAAAPARIPKEGLCLSA